MTTKIKLTPSPAAIAARAIKRSLRSDGSLTALATATGCPVNAEVDTNVTGTWRFDLKANRHEVRLGDKFGNALRQGAMGTRSESGRQKQQVELGVRILRHEAWHGRVTVRDLDQIAAQCKARSIPFLLVNLMEDMRLEEAARVAEGESFEWWRFLDYKHARNPLEALMNMVIHESPRSQLFVPATHPKAQTHGLLWSDKVTEFAQRIKAAADTFAVVDLAQDWVEYWASEGWTAQQQTVPNNGVHTGDRIGTDSDGSLQVNSTHRSEQDRVHAPQGNHSNTATIPTRMPKRVEYTRFRDYHGGLPLVGRDADAVASEMRGILARTASQHSVRVASTGSRLHVAGVAARSEQAFRTYGKTGGRPRITVLMDFSGSMARDWAEHGRLFTAAMLRLIRTGAIDGRVYATGGGTMAELPATLSDAELNTLGPHKNGENIRDTLAALQQEVRDSDVVLIYTDGELMDGHVDAGEWRRKGVDLVGSVVIGANRSENWRKDKIALMTQHFGAPVTAENGKTLARKLAQYLGARWR